MFIAIVVLPASAQSHENSAFFLHTGVLSTEGEIVSDHGDEFAIGGLSFDIRNRISEELGCV